MLKQIFQYKDLMFMLIKRDLKIRYKQAAMGFLWAIFMPIMAIAAGVIIKFAISILSGKGFEIKEIVTVSVKVLPWTFFVNAIKFSVNSLVGNRELITKIYFPREVFPWAATLACFFDFIIAGITLLIFLFFAQIDINMLFFWVPYLLTLLLLFTLGLGFMLSSANLFFRDVKYIVEIILMFGMFFTPVFYEAKTFGKWGNILLLNPIGSILELINQVLVLKQSPDIFWIFYTSITSIAFFILGMLIFNKLEPLFADYI